MSIFFSERYAQLEPYTPGEQPGDQRYIKLNTNENPYSPPPEVEEVLMEEWEKLRLYPDPECRELRGILSDKLGALLIA